MPASARSASRLYVSWKLAYVVDAVSLRGKHGRRCLVRRQRSGTLWEVKRRMILSVVCVAHRCSWRRFAPQKFFRASGRRDNMAAVEWSDGDRVRFQFAFTTRIPERDNADIHGLD